MLTIKTPQKYSNLPDIIEKAGTYIKEYGKKALIVGGNTAFQVTGDKFLNSLEENSIIYKKVIFEGYPSLRQIENYTKLATDFEADSIIAVGGGRVHDLVKVVGNRLEIPVIAVPTIAATCAAWAAVSIIYDDEGGLDTIIWNKETPKLILADTRIIINAPSRYINAGIIDTLAKWYEINPNRLVADGNITYTIINDTSKLAFDLLKEHGTKAVEEGKKGIVSDAAIKTIDAIIYLAGFVGSFTEEKFYGGFAHPFYNVSTRVASTRFRLHGERVAFGLLVQLVLEKKSKEYIVQTINEFNKYNLALNLEDIGIKEKAIEDVHIIATGIINEYPGLQNLGYGKTIEEIEEAIFEADEIIKNTLEKQLLRQI